MKVMEDYKFKSEVVLGLLPSGVTHLSEVTRQEAITALGEVGERLFQESRIWVSCAFNKEMCGNSMGYDFEVVRLNFMKVKADYLNLKSKLKEDGNDITDCEGEGCEECMVCKYYNAQEHASAIGCEFGIDEVMEQYIKGKGYAS